MSRSEPRRPLGEWLEEAYSQADHCASVEALAEAAAGSLSPEARRELDEHLASCPACAAEWELAKIFADDEAASGERREDVDYVVAHLERQFESSGQPAPSRAASGEILPFPRPSASPPPRRRWLPLAAAIVLVVGLGSIVQSLRPGAPSLPGVGPDEVVRSASVSGLTPAGEITDAPELLSWSAHPGATGYRVRIVAVDDAILLEEVVPSSSLSLPVAVRVRLRPAAVYHWQVEALDERGGLMAWSERVSFRIAGGTAAGEPN